MRQQPETKISFRTMTSADIAAGLALCRASRWNQTRRDWELFPRLSPDGCRVAVKGERVIGTVTTVLYEDRFSWIGMVLVDPAERGQGIGTQLMQEAMQALRDQRSIRLDATPAGHPVYRKLGFMDEYGLSRMEGAAAEIAAGDNPARPMTLADLPGVREMDRRVFGADRGAMLEWMFEGAPAYAWIVTDGDGVAGYSFGRHGFNFEHLGPVVARDRQTARCVVSACLNRSAGRSFILDASRHDPDWRRWLESIGFREQRPFIRMFYGENRYPGLPEFQFAILGPEFG
jgi:GNAT superfamily N-acetyltransferase